MVTSYSHPKNICHKQFFKAYCLITTATTSNTIEPVLISLCGSNAMSQPLCAKHLLAPHLRDTLGTGALRQISTFLILCMESTLYVFLSDSVCRHCDHGLDFDISLFCVIVQSINQSNAVYVFRVPFFLFNSESLRTRCVMIVRKTLLRCDLFSTVMCMTCNLLENSERILKPSEHSYSKRI